MKGKSVASFDYYVVRAASFLTNYDRKVVLRLYQPICGFGAISLFFTLWSEVDNRAMITSRRTHEDILETTGCTITEFESFRDKLEGIGLMKTYLSKGEDGSDIYYYELYSPIPADKFLSHELYGTLLRQKVSQSRLEDCIAYFRMKNEIEVEHMDISHPFNEVFSLNMDDTLALKQTLSSYDNIDAKTNTLTLASAFNLTTFYAYLRAKLINKSVITKDVIDVIRLEAAKYNLDEENVATIISKCIKVKGVDQFVDIDKFKKNCAKNTILFGADFAAITAQPKPKTFANKNELFDGVEPAEYLQYRQSNKEPTSTDLTLIEKIKKETNLPSPVVNVLLDYVLIVCNNTLPTEFTITLATELRNNEVTTSRDAQKYLIEKKKKIESAKARKRNTLKAGETMKLNSSEYESSVIDVPSIKVPPVEHNPDAVRESNFTNDKKINSNDDLGFGEFESELAAWRKSIATKKGGK